MTPDGSIEDPSRRSAARSLGLRARVPWHGIAAGALTVLALSPFLVVLATRTGEEHVPIYDEAVVDLRVRDVFSENPPLVGPFSRYRWTHPGPVMFAVPALVGLPFGHPAWATLVGGAVLQGIAISCVALLAWRRGGLLLVVVALGGLGMAYSAMNDWIVLVPLNVAVAYPFLALLVLLAWSAAEGSRWSWVGVVVVGTFLVQSHLGYAVLVGACVLVAVGASVVRRVFTREELVVPVAVALACGLVLWFPPVVQQLTSEQGNLGLIVEHFTGDAPFEPLGLVAGAEIVAVEFRPPLPWLGGSDPLVGSSSLARGASAWWLLAPIALLGAAGVAAYRYRSARAAALVAFGAVIATAAVVSVARITDLVPIRFSVLWRTPVAVIVVLTAVAAAVSILVEPWRTRATVTGVVVLIFGATAGFGGLAVQALDGREVTSESARLMIAGLEVPDDPVLVRGYSALGPEGLHAVVVNELDRRDSAVFVEDALALKFGEHRVSTTDDVEAIWYVVEHGQLATYLAARPGARVLARTSSLPPAEERELRALERDLIAELEAAGRTDLIRRMDDDDALEALRGVAGLDPSKLDRMVELTRRSAEGDPCRCAVVAFPPGEPPPSVY